MFEFNPRIKIHASPVAKLCAVTLVLAQFLAGAVTALADNHANLILLAPGRDGSVQMATQTQGAHADLTHLLDCIFREMDLGYQLAPMPSRRAEMAFDNGVASAILDTYQGQLPDLPSYAAPLMPQQWTWFFKAESAWRADILSFQDQAQIAVPGQYGLQRHMLELGFATVVEASDIPQLVQLLHYGRVDAVLAPSATFQEAARVLGYIDNQFRSETQATWHLVVRFRHDFAEANPDMLAAFANARATCNSR